MKTVKICDIVKISKGKKATSIFDVPNESRVRFIQIEDLRNNNNLKFTEDKGVSVKADDIIIAWDGANAGTIGYGLNGIIGSTLAKLEIQNEEITPQFLGKFLHGKFRYLRDRCTGATIPHISKTVLNELLVPVPPLEDQKRVVRELDAADALRKKRKQVIALLDDYLKAVFLEMFGDPVTNSKDWDKDKFGKIGTLDRGISKHRPRNAPELLGGTHPLIQTGDVSNAGMYIKDYRSTYSDIGLNQSKKWKSGTLCITIAANIAKTGILTFDACFPDSVVGFIPNDQKTNNKFIHFWMSFFQKILEANAPESAQKNINLRILRDLDVIVPPVELQNKFANIVRKVEQLRVVMSLQSGHLEGSFNAQMQEVFSQS